MISLLPNEIWYDGFEFGGGRMADVRTLSDGRTIMASCSTGGCIQAGGSLGQ